MRGKHRPSASVLVYERIIPAHAGQTNRSATWTWARPDHPRTCGANGYGVVEHAPPIGSSPHMRGKPRQPKNSRQKHRIIPAHAGQTYGFLVPLGPDSDHPRTCGANCHISVVMNGSNGSSPHMRGKLIMHRLYIVLRRIIPAHAGQTLSRCRRSAWCSDHPRTCGANYRGYHEDGNNAGSSPHMRGKLAYRGFAHSTERIIPAHAGQTPSRIFCELITPDHPRTCGANCRSTAYEPATVGSSPHMRGKPGPTGLTLLFTRIIPAHAGQTSRRASLVASSADHPRTCGANGYPSRPVVCLIGSSPHMRGKHHPEG